MLIGLVGKAGAGKTTIADYLIKKYGFKRYSFATPLKEMLIKAGMCSYEEVYVQKTKKSRWLLQKVGTDIFRNQVDPDFWVKKMIPVLQNALASGEKVVIDDIRFPNEVQLIKNLQGFIVKVERTDYIDQAAGNHESETTLDLVPIKFDHVIRAGSGEIDSLYQQIEDFVCVCQGQYNNILEKCSNRVITLR